MPLYILIFPFFFSLMVVKMRKTGTWRRLRLLQTLTEYQFYHPLTYRLKSNYQAKKKEMNHNLKSDSGISPLRHYKRGALGGRLAE